MLHHILQDSREREFLIKYEIAEGVERRIKESEQTKQAAKPCEFIPSGQTPERRNQKRQEKQNKDCDSSPMLNFFDRVEQEQAA